MNTTKRSLGRELARELSEEELTLVSGGSGGADTTETGSGVFPDVDCDWPDGTEVERK